MDLMAEKIVMVQSTSGGTPESWLDLLNQEGIPSKWP